MRQPKSIPSPTALFLRLCFLALLAPLVPLARAASTMPPPTPSTAAATSTNAAAKYKVPLEIHIMSQCPDAAYAFNNLIHPALLQLGEDKVDYQQSFIGSETSAGGVACKHGPDECLGNMLHLCAAALSPPSSLGYLPFTKCLLDDFGRVTEQEFVEGCARDNGLDFAELNACVSRVGPGGGLDLLLGSVRRSAEAGVKVSCTVRVEGRTVCLRDGDQWRDCPYGHEVADLVQLVEKAYRRGNQPGQSSSLQAAVEQARDADKIDWMAEEL